MNTVPLRLLVIEDAPDDAELLRLELRRAGYDVTMKRVETLDGMAGALEEREWDLVVSDHSMPGMTSFSALEVLRNYNLDPPFIICSGGIGEEEAVAAMRAGAPRTM
jgi:CheY-like chemotaxis protein